MVRYAFALPSLLIRSKSVVIPFQSRCKSVPLNRRKMGVASSLVGSCIGLALESPLRYFYRIMLKLMFLLCRLLKKLYLCLRNL